MKEIITEYLPTIMSALVSIVVAVSSLVTFLVSQKITNAKLKEVEEALQRAKDNEVYTVCPKCGEKTPLSSLEFHLPSGGLDNNLNGIDDSLENLDTVSK